MIAIFLKMEAIRYSWNEKKNLTVQLYIAYSTRKMIKQFKSTKDKKKALHLITNRRCWPHPLPHFRVWNIVIDFCKFWLHKSLIIHFILVQRAMFTPFVLRLTLTKHIHSYKCAITVCTIKSKLAYKSN